MSRKNNPWFKFHPSDWRADPALKLCCLAARGLWMEMLCIMHEAEPYGHLKVRGVPLDASALAALTGAPEDSVRACLHELEARGVLSRNREGVVFSRRMIRDAERQARDKANGAKGGNPQILRANADHEKPRAARVNPAGVNPQLNPPVNGGVKAKKLEAREDTPSDDKSSSVVSTLRADTDRTFQALWAIWPSVARKRHSQAQTCKALEAALKAGAKPEDIILAGQRHVAERGAKGDEFVKGLVPWLRGDLWRNWLDDPASPGGTVIDATPEIWAKRIARWQGDNEAWNRGLWGPPPNERGYRGPPVPAAAPTIPRQAAQQAFAL